MGILNKLIKPRSADVAGLKTVVKQPSEKTSISTPTKPTGGSKVSGHVIPRPRGNDIRWVNPPTKTPTRPTGSPSGVKTPTKTPRRVSDSHTPSTGFGFSATRTTSTQSGPKPKKGEKGYMIHSPGPRRK